MKINLEIDEILEIEIDGSVSYKVSGYRNGEGTFKIKVEETK